MELYRTEASLHEVMEESERCRKKERRKAEKRHKCPKCEAAFAFPNKLRLHINSHHSLSHVCDHCEARFDRFVQLRTHMAFAHKTKHRCHLCAYSSSVKAELRKHIVANHENGVTCTIDGCNITIAYNRLKRHIREVHCPDTRKRTMTADGHSTERLARGGITTDDCSSIASTREDFAECSNTVKQNGSPMEKRIDESPHLANSEESISSTGYDLPGDGSTNPNCETGTESVCSVAMSNQATSCVATCSHHSDSGSVGSFGSDRGAELSDAGDFAVEAGADTPELHEYPLDDGICQGEFTCAVCRKRFRTLRDEKRHYRRVHDRTYKKPKRERKYRCSEPGCGRTFCLPAKLREHEAFHKGANVISCNSCDKYFKSRALYAIHLRRYHQLSIRNVNCSPRFISVLKVEASERFEPISKSSTSDEVSDDVVRSSSCDSIADECVNDIMVSDSGVLLNRCERGGITSDSSLVSTGEVGPVPSGHFMNTGSKFSKVRGGAGTGCSSTDPSTVSDIAMLKSAPVSNILSADARLAGSEESDVIAAALERHAADLASASTVIAGDARRLDSEGNVGASVEDQNGKAAGATSKMLSSAAIRSEA